MCSLAGNLDEVVRLISSGTDPAAPDGDGMTPLHHAVRHNHLDIVRHLAEKLTKEALNAQDSQRQQTALHKVSREASFTTIPAVNTHLVLQGVTQV